MASLSNLSKGLLALILILAGWLTFEAGAEAWRMAAGRPEGTAFSQLLRQRVAQLPPAPAPAPRTQPGESLFTAPIGDGEHLLPAYQAAPIHAIFTRHSLTGDHALSRLLVDFMHVFGGISCISLCAMFLTSRAAASIRLAVSRMLLTNVYLMAATGLILFFTQLAGDFGFPSLITAAHAGGSHGDKSLMSLGFIGAFGVSFLSVGCHINALRGVPTRLIFGQHLFSLACCFITLPYIFHRLLTIDPGHFLWGYHLELLVLFSFYPVLDLVNGYALYKSEVRGLPHDWERHREDNVIALLVLAVTVVICFACSDKYWFFNGQLPLAWRIGLEMIPSLIWLASGRMPAFFLRAFRVAPAPAAGQPAAA
ncbi:MAG: hypothetical protein VKP62_14405 [Candidatus Sericytochromatia bacterium]|nr:hypothetical protein [Candidatus Sericytochromatia bacterium]